MPATAKDVAQWMADTLAKDEVLSQRTAALTIAQTFGEEFVYRNKNGNFAIDANVLKEFNKLTKDTAIWIRKRYCWRLRRPEDSPARQQRF